MRAAAPLRLALGASLALLLLAPGCTHAPERDGGRRASLLPDALAARWTPPAAATRTIDADRDAALAACVDAANALGYTVRRVDAASGRISALRAPEASFDGARQVTLDIRLTVIAPETTQVALVLREAVETEGDERSGPQVTTAVVRDRAYYDAYFARLATRLSGKTEG